MRLPAQRRSEWRDKLFVGFYKVLKPKSKSHCGWWSVSQSVSLGVEPHLGHMTRYLLLFDSYGLVIVGRPLWREDGSVFCICCYKVLVSSVQVLLHRWH
jgi:hypothetical protein